MVTNALVTGVIRVPGEDGQGPVDLLGQDERRHLVRQRHWPEGKQQFGALATGLREAIRWAHAEDKLLTSSLFQFAKLVSKLGRTKLLSPRVKKYEKAWARLSVHTRTEALLREINLLFNGGILPHPFHIRIDQRTPFGAFAGSPDSTKN